MVAVASARLGPEALAELMPSDEDLLYEEELLRNPYSLKLWWRYLDARKDAVPKRRYLLYERALKTLPGSYKVRCPAPATSPCHLPSDSLLGPCVTRTPLPPISARSCGTRTCRSGCPPCAAWRSATPPPGR